jgi:hypothetical protein
MRYQIGGREFQPRLMEFPALAGLRFHVTTLLIVPRVEPFCSMTLHGR